MTVWEIRTPRLRKWSIYVICVSERYALDVRSGSCIGSSMREDICRFAPTPGVNDFGSLDAVEQTVMRYRSENPSRFREDVPWLRQP